MSGMAEEEEKASSRKCAYIISRRNRRCRMDAAKGSEYCGEHLLFDASNQSSGPGCRRVPCPLDPTHSVYEDRLQKHLKKCNVAKRPVPAGYSPAINLGGRAPPQQPVIDLASCSQDYLSQFISKVEAAYAAHLQSLPEAVEVKVHSSMAGELSDPINGASALKHLVQQASILGHLDGCGLLGCTSKATCYVEFGAGRGKLTACIHRALMQMEKEGAARAGCGIDYVLVDRSSCRRKIDGAYRMSQLPGALCHRLLIDIADLDLSEVDVIQKGCGLVGVAKHLCGAATDLALRCLLNTLPQDCHAQSCDSHSQSCDCHSHSQDGDLLKEKESGFGGTRLLGVAMALCCHHRCNWLALVGGEFLEECGFSAEEFHLLCQLTSWAVCGIRPPAELDGGHKNWGYVPHPREGVGLKCKRLIDLCRVHYLRSRGFSGRLVHYVERGTSLENVLLLAVPMDHCHGDVSNL